MSKRNKLLVITTLILLVIVTVVGISYAYWRLTYTQTGVNKLISSCFSMELTNEKNNITLDSAYPISDEKGKALTPYSFTITNTCDLFASYTINLEMLEGTTLNSKYIKTMINSEAITNLNTLDETDTSSDGAVESRILFNGSLGSGDSTDYTLRLWIDSETPATDDTMNKIFQAKITVTGEVSTYSPVENGFTNLAEALLVNEYQTTNLNIAKDRISSKQSVNFSKTAPISDWQENTTQTISGTLVWILNEDLVGSYGITEEDTKALVGLDYSFDSTTGQYTLEDQQLINFEDIADYSGKNYYLCYGSSYSTSTSNKVSVHRPTQCTTMYRITSYSKEPFGITTSDESSINIYKYEVKGYVYNQIELESDKSDKGIYEATDDYGTTYYYRGNVTNNYVKFGGFYWRVIRVNGDGSTRLLYIGDNINTTNNPYPISKINNQKNNPIYAGYMYGNVANESYESNIKNEIDSALKITLDDWYKTNILDKGYSSYIADSGFCNDRSLSSGDGVSLDSLTIYSGWDRLTNSNPSLICPNVTNDLFTLSNNTIGNKALTYPIGLITVDELAFSGHVYNTLNRMAYTYDKKQSYWTMTPRYFNIGNSSLNYFYLTDTGALTNTWVSIDSGIRPVINLKNTTEISGGIGTKNDPFIVK